MVVLHSARGIFSRNFSNSVERYCPVTCLPFMWKLLTEIIAEQMYDYLEQLKLETVARRTEKMQTKKLWNKGSITY